MKHFRKIIVLTGLTLAGLMLYKCNAYDIMGKMYSPAPLRVFITTLTTKGDMSFTGGSTQCSGTGISKANCVCQQLAFNANIAQNGALFKAWLSDSTTDALCNIVGKQGTTVGGSGCGGHKASEATYVDINYNPVFHNWDDIKAGANPMRNINTMENKGLAPAQGGAGGTYYVWTGTYTGGMGSQNNCSNWTSTAGAPISGDAGDFSIILGWSLYAGALPCGSIAYPIYCFEQP